MVHIKGERSFTVIFRYHSCKWASQSQSVQNETLKEKFPSKASGILKIGITFAISWEDQCFLLAFRCIEDRMGEWYAQSFCNLSNAPLCIGCWCKFHCREGQTGSQASIWRLRQWDREFVPGKDRGMPAQANNSSYSDVQNGRLKSTKGS